jgi:hypothetical protein
LSKFWHIWVVNYVHRRWLYEKISRYNGYRINGICSRL